MMLLTCLDLEGVLVPEIWIKVAEKTGIEDLKLTTRDISDYNVLMKKRLSILDENKLTLNDIQEVIATIDPIPGAVEFVEWLRRESQLIILSDTFSEFAAPLMEKLNMPTIFCHSLEVDKNSRIVDYSLRIDDPKRRAIQAFHGLNFKTIAAGDSYNDITMIKEAHHGAFFKPPERVVTEFPEFPVAYEYDDLKKIFEGFFQSEK
ncbi:MAG: phosphoserine/homoserine phosphotransferase [bacterium]|jgi:phosphoserine/homoserine phosphotransferase